MKINKICCLGLPSNAIFFLVYFYKVYSVLLKYIFPRPLFWGENCQNVYFYYISCFCLQWRFKNRVNHFFKWNLGGFRNKIESIKMLIILWKTQSYHLLETTNPLKIISMKYFFHYWSPLMINLNKNYPSVLGAPKYPLNRGKKRSKIVLK